MSFRQLSFHRMVRPIMDHLHWRRLLAKLSALATCNSHYCTCLGQFGSVTQIGSFLFYVTSPKVTKAGKEGVITQAILRPLSHKTLPMKILLKIGPICMSMEDVAVCAGYEVLIFEQQHRQIRTCKFGLR